MTAGPSNVAGRDWIAAFVQPPRLVDIGQRVQLADGSVRVLSHIELWRWRTVIRGVYAHSQPRRTDGWVAPWRAEPMNSDWFAGWRLGDDLGSEYRRTGAGIGGAAGDLWQSFNIEFALHVPSDASRLRIETPDGDHVEVAI